ncbi:Uncharacterized protein Rs2_16763 [Raphanus sativus]|nr:Uncharacterized protein Rs2_16763 [Raphanus sativus]
MLHSQQILDLKYGAKLTIDPNSPDEDCNVKLGHVGVREVQEPDLHITTTDATIEKTKARRRRGESILGAGEKYGHQGGRSGEDDILRSLGRKVLCFLEPNRSFRRFVRLFMKY